MAGAEQTVEVEATPKQLFEVITDYARYPEFLSEMEAAEVVGGSGDVVDVRFTLNLIKKLTYTLRLRATPYSAVSWHLLDGAFKTNDGGWTLEELEGGRTRATYRLDVSVGVFVPGTIVRRLVGSTLPDTLAAFKARAEAHARGELR